MRKLIRNDVRNLSCSIPWNSTRHVIGNLIRKWQNYVEAWGNPGKPRGVTTKICNFSKVTAAGVTAAKVKLAKVTAAEVHGETNGHLFSPPGLIFRQSVVRPGHAHNHM